MTRSTYDSIKAIGEAIIASTKAASDEALQAEIDRPFQGGVNSQFDHAKWCAMVELSLRQRLRQIEGGK